MKNLKRLLVFFAAAMIAGTTYAYTPSTMQTQMLTDLNTYRQGLGGQPALVANDALMQAAQDYACKLNDGIYPYQHVQPSGVTPQDRMIAAGYRGVGFGENLNKGTTRNNSSSMTMYTLWNSPGHKANIVNPLYTEVGVGQCGLYRVQNFGIARQEFNYPRQVGDYSSYDTESPLWTTGMDIQFDFDRDYTMIRNGVRIYFKPRTETFHQNVTTTTSTNSSTITTNDISTAQQRVLDRLNIIYRILLNGKKFYIQ